MTTNIAAIGFIDDWNSWQAVSAGDTFKFLAAGELSGTFASESLPAIPGKPGLQWLVDYDTISDRILLSVAPIFEADFDEDGDVDGDDLVRWQAGYGTGTLPTEGGAILSTASSSITGYLPKRHVCDPGVTLESPILPL